MNDFERTPHDFIKYSLTKIIARKITRIKKSGSKEAYILISQKVMTYLNEIRFYAIDDERIVILWNQLRDDENMLDIVIETTNELILCLNLSGIVTWSEAVTETAVALGAAIAVEIPDTRNVKPKASIIDDKEYFERVKDHQWWFEKLHNHPWLFTLYYLSFLTLTDA